MGNTPAGQHKAACSYETTTGDSFNGAAKQTHWGVNPGDTALMMFGTTLVMCQTPAMGIAQAGMIRRKNSLSMMMQCMSGMAIGSVLFWLIGFGLSFGETLNGEGFIGDPYPFLAFWDMPRAGEARAARASSFLRRMHEAMA